MQDTNSCKSDSTPPRSSRAHLVKSPGEVGTTTPTVHQHGSTNKSSSGEWLQSLLPPRPPLHKSAHSAVGGRIRPVGLQFPVSGNCTFVPRAGWNCAARTHCLSWPCRRHLLAPHPILFPTSRPRSNQSAAGARGLHVRLTEASAKHHICDTCCTWKSLLPSVP